MLKALIVFCLTLGPLCGPALAEWQQYFSDSNSKYYVDFSSLSRQRDGSLVCFERQIIHNSQLSNQLMRNFKLSAPPVTIVTTIVYDCANGRAKPESITFYSGRNEALGTANSSEQSFKVPTPGTIGENMLRQVCQKAGSSNQPGRQAEDQPQAPAQAAPAQATPKATLSTGSGFFVTASGLVLTNYHVIENKRQIYLVSHNSKQPLTVVAVDANSDLALLRSGQAAPEYFRFAGDKQIRQGEEVIVMGYPLQGLITEDLNVTNGIISALSGPGNDPRLLQTTAPVQPGNSGGPLLDTYGHVVGVVAAKLNALKTAKLTGDIPQNINFAINKSVAQSFLASNGVAFESSPSGTPLKPADLVERYKRAVVKIAAQ